MKDNEILIDNQDENGGHGYIEHAAFGNAIVHVFYADDSDGDGDGN